MTPSTSTIQITRWLRQVAVWRFVGLVSTIVGLLCYALSSSFSYLFGEWNLFKIFLYGVFSLFICFWSLIAKVCQGSTSLRIKAHSAFLVLTITSVFSYFTDKAVKRKPDAYSVISCVAFAIMSLCLSRQTECGFEVDLFYFFLACLIVLLMKIKLALTIVGVGFSYALIIFRSSLDTTSYQNLAFQDDHSVVIDVNSLRNDTANTMQRLVACMKALKQSNSKLTSMLFKHVKENHEDNSETTVIDRNFVIDSLPLGKVDDLGETIRLMMDNGLAEECFEMYCNWRRESLEESLISLLGLPKIKDEKKRKGMEFKDFIMRRRIKVIKVALRTLLPSERRLCDRVFAGFSSSADRCFTDVCRGVTIQLLNIANVFASGIPSCWRLFEIVSMFQAWRDEIPDFQSLFSESLVKEAMTFHGELGEASRDILMKVTNLIFLHPKAELIAIDGRILVMTITVMSYLISTCLAKQTLQHNGAGTSSFSTQIDRIMKRLERKLVAESKNMDPASQYFFMMNNWRFVELSIQESGLDLDCFKKYTTKVGQNLELYLRCSWNMVLDILNLENNDFNAESLKGNLKLFNKHFEDICNSQSRLFVFDNQLMEQIIMALQDILLPPYGNFIGRYQDILGKHARDCCEYINYGMFDIQDQLNHMFVSSSQSNYYLKEGTTVKACIELKWL